MDMLYFSSFSKCSWVISKFYYIIRNQTVNFKRNFEIIYLGPFGTPPAPLRQFRERSRVERYSCKSSSTKLCWAAVQIGEVGEAWKLQRDPKNTESA